MAPVAAPAAIDPLIERQWAIERVGAAAAWDILPAVRHETLVAIVDTGVDLTHPDLAPRLWRSPAGLLAPDGRPLPPGSAGWDFVDSDPDPSPVPGPADPHVDTSTHGTT